MVVGTIGAGVPEEVLVAAGARVVPIVGKPGDGTELADRYVEPMVGERARSQLQRVLDGTYAHIDLLAFSREEDAPLRLFYVLREVRRLEPGRLVPELHLLDIEHMRTPATRRWNEDRVRDLCDLVGADADSLARALASSSTPGNGRDSGREHRRVYVTGSAHTETELAAAVEAAGGTIVDGRPVPTDEELAPVEAIARRLEHPLLARARASSVERASAIAEDAVAAAADVVVAFYLEHDDGLRWEYPELRAALERRGVPVILLDHQPYDLRGLELHV